MFKASRQHLREAGESYTEHMRFASTAGAIVLGAGLACLLHAVVPAACQRTCSRSITQLQVLFADRTQLGRVKAEAAGLLDFVVLVLLTAATAALPLVLGAAAGVGVIIAASAFAFPVAYLSSNPELQTSAS